MIIAASSSDGGRRRCSSNRGTAHADEQRRQQRGQYRKQQQRRGQGHGILVAVTAAILLLLQYLTRAAHAITIGTPSDNCFKKAIKRSDGVLGNGEYPWFVGVVDEDNLLVCSGSLVGHRYVITTSLCGENGQAEAVVVNYRCSNEGNEPPNCGHDTERISIAETYSSVALSLLILDRQPTMVKPSETAVPDLGGVELKRLRKKSSLLLVGAGRSEDYYGVRPVQKQTIKFRSAKKCAKMDFPTAGNNGYLCFSAVCGGPCPGDGGGPILTRNAEGQDVILGVLTSSPGFLPAGCQSPRTRPEGYYSVMAATTLILDVTCSQEAKEAWCPEGDGSGDFEMPKPEAPVNPPLTRPSIPTALPSPQQPSPPGIVKGHIDGVTNGSPRTIVGWACQEGDSQSIIIHLYLGGPAGTGQFWKAGSANQNSESAVAHACKSTGTKHRFGIPISDNEARDHEGKAIYIHGISTKQTGNLVIANSGKYKIPKPTSTGGVSPNQPSIPPPTPPVVVPNPPPNPPTFPAPPVPTTLPPGSTLLSNFLTISGRGDITIPSGTSVVIDTSTTVGLVKIEGKLLCPPDGRTFQLRTDGILVEGRGSELRCGVPSSRFSGKLDLIFQGNRDLNILLGGGNSLGTKALVVSNDGVLNLHGADPEKGGFQILEATATAGTRQITISDGKGWQAGDTIVITSSGFDQNQAEERVISVVSADKKTLTLDKPLSHYYHGALQSYTNNVGMTWSLDERCEVINLSRSIRIMSADDSYTLQEPPIGAHVMVQGAGSQAYVDSVEFTKVGQLGKGRYPFHWHLKGSVRGQYIRNSSIHESYQRCVAIHQTNEARVERNSCYNHMGHGFFLEDGDEIRNVMTDNIGLLTKKAPMAFALLESEFRSISPSRFAAPSTYWIPHPDNFIKGNVAAGSEGSGFWMSFVPRTFGTSPIAQPLTSNTWVFDDNVAHSSVVGVTHDGAASGPLTDNPRNPTFDRVIQNAHYNPPQAPTFSNLVVYKNSLSGIYYRGNRAIYKNCTLADNAISGFFAYDQELIDTLLVGQSQNMRSDDIDYHWGGGPPQVTIRRRFEGLRIYDGPFYLQNVYFAGFSPTALFRNGIEITPTAFSLIGAAELWRNSAGEVSFEGTPHRKIYLKPDSTNWADSYGASVLDRDGSLAGIAGSVIRPDHPFNRDSRCRQGVPTEGEHYTLVCAYEVSYLRIMDVSTRNAVNLKFRTTRIGRVDGNRTSVAHNNKHHNKFAMIQGDEYDYEVSDLTWANHQHYRLKLFTEGMGDVSPLITIQGVPSSCQLRFQNRPVANTSSLASLRGFRGAGAVSFRSGSNLHLKLSGQTVNPKKRVDTYRGEHFTTFYASHESDITVMNSGSRAQVKSVTFELASVNRHQDLFRASVHIAP